MSGPTHRANLEPEQRIHIGVHPLLIVAHSEGPNALAEWPDLSEKRIRGDIGDVDVWLGQHFEVDARAGPVHPRVVGPVVGNRIDVVLLAAPDRNRRLDLSGRGVHRFPVVLVPVGHVQGLAVRRDVGAIRVRSKRLAPHFPVGRQIEADQTIRRVRGEIQPPQ